MGTKIEYVESAHLYATNNIRNSKAIAVLWAIFTICYAIISTVAFLTPEWVGDMDSDSAGRLGLWQVCQKDDTNYNCQNQFSDMLSVPPVPFQVATVFVGISVITAILMNCSFCLSYMQLDANIIRSNCIPNVDNLRAEVNQLETDFAQKRQMRANQMEALRKKMDAPYPVPDLQNFNEAVLVE